VLRWFETLQKKNYWVDITDDVVHIGPLKEVRSSIIYAPIEQSDIHSYFDNDLGTDVYSFTESFVEAKKQLIPSVEELKSEISMVLRKWGASQWAVKVWFDEATELKWSVVD
jgi:hypothetical protein